MTIYVDKRAGSEKLIAAIGQIAPAKGFVQSGIYDADVEFVGWGPDGPAILGIEHKRVADCLTSLTDGRLTGLQLPRMARSYERSYLVIEGALRIGKDGVLETQEYVHPTGWHWAPARGRGQQGWMAREFWGRLESLTEFWGVRVAFTHNLAESAAWVLAKYHYWQKPYEEHSSYRQWDQSKQGGASAAGNLLQPTSSLPLAQRWARELYNVGQEKAARVAAAFPSAGHMAIASAEDWATIYWDEKLKTKPGYRRRRLSAKMIARLMGEIWAEQGAK